MQRQTRSHFQAVRFVILHLGKVTLSLFDDHVASCAGATSATSMFQVDTKVKCDIEQRGPLAMLSVWQRFRIKLDRYIGRRKVTRGTLPFYFVASRAISRYAGSSPAFSATAAANAAPSGLFAEKLLSCTLHVAIRFWFRLLKFIGVAA